MSTEAMMREAAELVTRWHRQIDGRSESFAVCVASQMVQQASDIIRVIGGHDDAIAMLEATIADIREHKPS